MTINYPNHQSKLGLTLEQGAIVDLRPPREGVAIGVQTGKLWITQTGDPTDHVLTAGESFTACGNGMLVVQALETSRMKTIVGE